MHFRMAIHAAPAEQERRRLAAGQAFGCAGNTGMTDPGMAALTQQGRPLLQECRVIGTMGPVTVGAVVGNRRMLPEKRPTLVSMTAVATVIECGFFQHGRIQRPMRLMAVRTCHIAKTQWVRGHLMGLHLDTPVTIGADFCFPSGHRYRVFADMHLVAIHASHALSLMGPAIPVHALISLVTVETDSILFVL